MHMALASCNSLPADAACLFPAMAYRHPCDAGGLAASAFYGAARSPAAALLSQPQLAFGAAALTSLAPPPQPDAVFERLSEEGVSSVVPGTTTFGRPPPEMPVEYAVPDASGYAHHAMSVSRMSSRYVMNWHCLEKLFCTSGIGVARFDQLVWFVNLDIFRGAAAMAGAEGSTRTTDRIAFRVRSEEEVLDDGYKWRKYGKKSVKNSPNPRYDYLGIKSC